MLRFRAFVLVVPSFRSYTAFECEEYFHRNHRPLIPRFSIRRRSLSRHRKDPQEFENTDPLNRECERSDLVE